MYDASFSLSAGARLTERNASRWFPLPRCPCASAWAKGSSSGLNMPAIGSGRGAEDTRVTVHRPTSKALLYHVHGWQVNAAISADRSVDARAGGVDARAGGVDARAGGPEWRGARARRK